MNKKDFVNKVFITNSSRATQKLGHDFGRVLEKGDIVCLYGNLGSGKTTFTQGLAEGLGIKEKIISPTFIIIRSHKLRIKDEGLMINDFYHIDLYRIENEKDLEGLGIEEIINNKDNIIVIEWAEKLKNYLPQKRIDIKLSYEKNNSRKIKFGLTT